MKVTTKLSLKYLKQNRNRTAITVIGVILSTLLLTGVISMFTSLQHALINDQIRQSGNWDAQFVNVTYQNAKAITENTQVQTAMIRLDEGFALLSKPQNSYKPYIYLASYDGNMFTNYQLTLISGRLPVRAGEVVIESDLSTDENYHVGDRITLNVGQRTLPDGSFVPHSNPITQQENLTQTKAVSLSVVGIIKTPAFGSRMTPGFMAITYLDRQSLLPGDTVNISILAKNPAGIYTLAPQLASAAHLKSDNVGYNKNLLQYRGISSNSSYYTFMYTVGGILVLIIIIGAMTLIYNSFAISTSERTRQFGILSSVGATHRQIRRIIIHEALVICLFAIPAGILMGLGGLAVLLRLIKPLVSSVFNRGGGEFDITLYVQPVWIVISAALGILTVYLSALIPVFRIRNISAMDAIRQSKELEVNPKNLKISPFITKFFGAEGHLAMKSYKRNRKRYHTIVLSLTLSIVLFISISAATLYMTTSVRLSKDSINYNVGVGLAGLDSRNAELIKKISSIKNVTDYSTLREVKTNANFDTSAIASELSGVEGFKAGTQKVYINSLGDSKLKTILDSIGADIGKYTDTNNPRCLLINKGVFNCPGMRIESQVFSKLPNKVTISGGKSIINMAIGNTINYSPIGINNILEPGLNLIVSDEVYDAMKFQNTSKGGISFLQVCITSDNVSETVSSINQLLKSFNIQAVYVMDINSALNNQRNIMLLIQIFTFGFIALITLIGISNVINTISTGVALRRKELAMLKSVGMTPHSFDKMIRFESLFYGFKALIYGLPIGIVLSVLLYIRFIKNFVFDFSLPWDSVVICIIGVFAIVFGTMSFSNHKINKENIVDALRSDIS